MLTEQKLNEDNFISVPVASCAFPKGYEFVSMFYSGHLYILSHFFHLGCLDFFMEDFYFILIIYQCDTRL